jgi:hypothetical protein
MSVLGDACVGVGFSTNDLGAKHFFTDFRVDAFGKLNVGFNHGRVTVNPKAI